jgi:anti-anti-sigma regulatory factor
MKLEFGSVDKFLARIDLSRQIFQIDLSQVDFIDQFALVYLGMFMHSQNLQGRQY